MLSNQKITTTRIPAHLQVRTLCTELIKWRPYRWNILIVYVGVDGRKDLSRGNNLTCFRGAETINGSHFLLRIGFFIYTKSNRQKSSTFISLYVEKIYDLSLLKQFVIFHFLSQLSVNRINRDK